MSAVQQQSKTAVPSQSNQALLATAVVTLGVFCLKDISSLLPDYAPYRIIGSFDAPYRIMGSFWASGWAASHHLNPLRLLPADMAFPNQTVTISGNVTFSGQVKLPRTSISGYPHQSLGTLHTC